MNKAYRLIWSDAWNAYVVAHENASACGHPSFTRRVIVTAITAACLAPVASYAGFTINGAVDGADSYTNPSGITVNDVIVTTPSTLLENFGTISGFNPYITEQSNTVRSAIVVKSDASIGTINNEGTISSTVYNNANGIIFDGGNLTGTIDNSGTIFVGHTSAGVEWATDIFVGGDITETGSITNSGTITAENNGTESHAYGIYINGDLAGNIFNTGTGGTIKVSATATDSNAFVAGIQTGSVSDSGLITNAGTISASANGTQAEAYGILIDGDLAGTIVNTSTGSISVSATASTSDAIPYGVYIQNMTGSLDNQGTISVTGIGTDTTAQSTGVHVDTLESDGTLTNSNTIEALGVANANATGVEISTLDGTLNNSGTITASAGAGHDAYSLWIDDGSGSVNNLAGGLLSGNLFVGGTVHVNNAGTIAIPAGISGTIAGNYTQTATGVFRTAVANDTTYSQLSVGGTANLPSNAKIDVNVIGSPILTLGTVLPGVLSASTLVSDNSFKVTDNSTLFDFRADVNSNAVDLTIKKGMTVVEATESEGNSPAIGAATALDSIIDDPALGSDPRWQPVITALGRLTSSKEVSDAASQTLPLLSGSADFALMNSLLSINRIVQARQDTNFGLSSGDQFFTDKNLWIKPFGSWADQDDRKGVSGFDADTYGFIFGADGVANDADRLGVAFAYSNSNVDGNNDAAPNSADINSYQVIGYGSHALDHRTELNYQADLGYHQTEGERDITFMGTVADSDYNSISAHLGGGIGRVYSFNDKTAFVPSARIDYTWLRDNSYSEKGADVLNLDVDSNTIDELILGVNAKLTHKLTDKATVAANIGTGYDFINDSSSITSSFAGAPTAIFTTEGLDPSPWLINGGLGLTLLASDTIEVSAGYAIQARDDFSNQTVSVKMNWSF